MLLIEAVGINKNHLQEAVGQVLHRKRKEIPDASEDFFAFPAGIGKGYKFNAFGKLRSTQKIFVASRNIPEVLVGLEVLNVRFD